MEEQPVLENVSEISEQPVRLQSRLKDQGKIIWVSRKTHESLLALKLEQKQKSINDVIANLIIAKQIQNLTNSNAENQ